MVKSPSMALSFDDRRKLAAAYDVFARVDARRKAAKRSRRKSKPRDEIKPRSPTGLRGFFYGNTASPFLIKAICHDLYSLPIWYL